MTCTTTCPNCTSADVKTPRFTWWGGALGAHLLRHRICRFCSFAFDAKTGASNRRAIVFYVLATNTAFFMLMSVADMLTR